MHVLSWVAAAHHVLMHEEADKLGPGKVKKRRPACLSHEASRSWPARHATKGGALRKEVARARAGGCAMLTASHERTCPALRALLSFKER